jgi:hypothetical protein
MTRPSPGDMYAEMATLGQAMHWGVEELLDLEHADRRRWLAHVVTPEAGG